MHFGHQTKATVIRRCTSLLKTSWRLALMMLLFAMTCWEVNPGQIPVQENAQAGLGAWVTATPANGDRIR